MMPGYRLLRVLEFFGIATRYRTDLDAVRRSGLFEADWYLAQLKQRVPRDPVAHYMLTGARRSLDPHPLFDTDYYAAKLARTDEAHVNPLAHYQTSGDAAGENPSPWFEGAWYRTFYEVDLPEGVTALRAYWDKGRFEGQLPHPLFELDWYRERYAGAMSDPDPVIDLVHFGLAAGRVPHRALDGDSRVPRTPQAVQEALEKAVATKEPQAPRVSSKRFDEAGESTFLAALDEKVAEAGILADAPKVSIIMPTRDRAAVLPKAIQSVVDQDYENWELLVVDDGSTDDTAAVVAGFSDPRIRYIAGTGEGAANARNIGLAEASGAFYAYLDSDNQWLPRHLRTMVAFLLLNDLDLAYAAMRLESEDAVRFRGRSFNYRDLLQLNYIDLNAIVHRRALTEAHGGFDVSLRRMMDWDLVLRYAKEARVEYAPFVGVIYDERRDGDRITVREPVSWRFQVQNRYLVDWAALEAELPARDRDLVSIVIPVYGKFELTNGCLESLFRHRGTKRFEIVIANNRSDHATFANMALWERARDEVRLVANATNLNFALGCNVGFAGTRGDIVVFLNNDTLVTDGWLEPLVEELESGRAAAVQPKLLYPDGTVQSYGAAFSEAGLISHILYRGEPGDAPHVNRRRELQAIHGACLAVRAADVVRLRGFDPQYVNGQEDIDFCLRLTAETGKPMVVEPRSTVFHLEGKTRSGRNPHNHRNRSLFTERWAGRIKVDDRQIYTEDGFTVTGYTPESEEMARQGIACFYPKLVRPE